ncbi:MAG TPA: 4a-hydroxytetrahydrobiopterin dehydratase [Ignavibacteriaceae bacterium]|nr:4a-hydroxytetrahydrobiopterin dehydratase [Ignavibacteriaceae bacterium]
MSALNKDVIENLLNDLDGWNYSDNQIQKEFEFKDFVEASSFVQSVAFEAEKMDHHPDILIHSWNKVKVSISTHSEGGVTEKDFNLAKKIEARFK